MASPTATLAGRITDSFGGVLAGAEVEATNIETNTVIRVTANRFGLYRIPNLPPGYYRVIVRMFGFRTMVKPGVKLHVQDIVALNFAMQIGSAFSSITQDDGVPLVQSETGMQSTTVNQLAITHLPSLTRNPYDFVALSAGAAPSTVNRGIGFTVNGQRAESGSFLLDGSDNNDPYNSGPGQIVPLDVVEEYRLMTHNFTSEYGRNTGFIANVVTKSGTNDLHGRAYYFNRNSAVAANTFENNSRGISRPVFNRHQLGTAIGGPVVRDKLFFYAAIEPILVRSSATLSYYVPTPELLAVSSAGTNSIFRHFPLPKNLSSTDVSIRTVCPFGRLCGSTINSGFVTIPAFAAATQQGRVDAGAGVPQNTVLWTGRMDYSLTDRSTLNLRYAYQDMDQFATVSQPYSAALDQASFIRNQDLTINLARFWTGNFYTESRIVFHRLFQESPSVPSNDFPSFTITGDTISGSNRGLSLPSGKNQFGGSQNAYQAYQAANWINGRHNLKFGGQYLHLRDNRIPTEVSFTRSNQGEFRDLQGFVDGFLSSYQIALDPRGKVPGELLDAPVGPPSFGRHYRFNDWALFFQDTWKISDRLTVSPGLRYEYFGSGHRAGNEKTLDASFYYGPGNTVYERIANGQLLRTTDAPGKFQNHYYLPSWRNLAPRLGLAYDLSGNGTTVVRLAGGVFYDRLPGFAYENSNPPTSSFTRLTGVALTPELFENAYSVFPDSAFPLPPSAVTNLDQELKTAFVTHWDAAIEHEIARGVVVSGAYLGSKGQRLYRLLNVNRIGSGGFLDRPNERLFGQASSITTVSNTADSSYHALQVRVESPTSRTFGLQFGTNYTWSRSLDSASALLIDDALGSAFPLDAFNPGLDEGPSDHDVRHRFAGHFIWQLPFARTGRGLVKQLAGGWELSGILSFQTGQPFGLRDNRVADRDLADNTRPRLTGALPEALRGSEIVADARTPNSFLILPLNVVRKADGSCISNSAPFACQLSVNGPFNGTLGRNPFRQSGTHFQNVALMKNFALPRFTSREGMILQIRAEFYNLFNHSNLYLKPDTGNVAAAAFNPESGPAVPGVIASFGTPARFPQEARQIVFAVKLSF